MQHNFLRELQGSQYYFLLQYFYYKNQQSWMQMEIFHHGHQNWKSSPSQTAAGRKFQCQRSQVLLAMKTAKVKRARSKSTKRVATWVSMWHIIVAKQVMCMLLTYCAINHGKLGGTLIFLEREVQWIPQICTAPCCEASRLSAWGNVTLLLPGQVKSFISYKHFCNGMRHCRKANPIL